MFLTQMKCGHTILVRSGSFRFLKLKGYIEESNEEVTLGKAPPASNSTLFSKEKCVISSANRLIGST